MNNFLPDPEWTLQFSAFRFIWRINLLPWSEIISAHLPGTEVSSKSSENNALRAGPAVRAAFCELPPAIVVTPIISLITKSSCVLLARKT